MANYAKIKARAAAARRRKAHQEDTAARAKEMRLHNIAQHLAQPTPVADERGAYLIQGAVDAAIAESLLTPGVVVGASTDILSHGWYLTNGVQFAEIIARDGVLLKMPRVTMFGQYAATDKTNA